MIILAWVLFTFYCLALSYITVFCLMQFHLLYFYQKNKAKAKTNKTVEPKLNGHIPKVTVQLPIFNEMYVVERLIDCIVQLEYPKEHLEIQVLDDSTDETINISRAKVAEYTKQGYNIKLVQRPDRKGYKAGALQYGLKEAEGEFVAIFDADFLPRKDFLMRTIPYFLENKDVGVVQTRWEHINEDYSIITKLQAFQLNVHFTVEQTGRESGDYMLQFNGTAGVWRKETIADAGGWQADTLTEDLDLSYRAQLKGWKITYLENIGSPAELPAEMNGLKSQQFRWMKGGAETAKKILPSIWKSKIPLRQKVLASVHLLQSGIFVIILITGIFSVPLLSMYSIIGVDPTIFALFFIGFISLIFVYFVANRELSLGGMSFPKKVLKFVFLFPLFLSLSMGLSLHNSLAVLQGYMGKKSAFIRTPKFDIKGISDKIKKSSYLAKRVPLSTWLEGVAGVYFLLAVVYAIFLGQYIFILFHSLLAVGFLTVCYLSIKHFRLYK